MEGGSALGSKKWSNEIYYICHYAFMNSLSNYAFFLDIRAKYLGFCQVSQTGSLQGSRHHEVSSGGRAHPKRGDIAC